MPHATAPPDIQQARHDLRGAFERLVDAEYTHAQQWAQDTHLDLGFGRPVVHRAGVRAALLMDARGLLQARKTEP